MVRTFLPSASQANIVQAFTALPSRCTTQAPHWDVSHPTCVPVSRRPSRRYWTSNVRGSASAVTALPFTVIETFAIRLLLESGPKGPHFDAGYRLRRIPGAKSGRFCRKSLFGTRMTLNPGRRRGQGRRNDLAPAGLTAVRLPGTPAATRRCGTNDGEGHAQDNSTPQDTTCRTG